jgi:phage terminase large subunit-like protein
MPLSKLKLCDILGIKDNGYFIADAIENEYIGYENMGNLTAMIPGLTDVISFFIKNYLQ